MTLQNREIRWKYAMNLARQLLLFQRLGGDFVFSNFNNTANTWGQNVIECAKEGVYLSASGRVLELMTRSPAAWPLRIEGMPETTELVAQAAWDADRKALVLVAINYLGNEQPFAFDLSSLDFKPKTAEATTLWAESLLSFNSLSRPDAVQRRDEERRLDGSAVVELTVPPYSVVHVVLR
jgi:alpha-L-arabinofuranosidase